MGSRVSQKEVVSAFMEWFWTKENPPSAEDLAEVLPYNANQIDTVLKRPEVITTLAAFHVPDKAQAQSLTPQQIVWANMILNIDDPRPMRKKAAEIGITMQQHAAWMNTPKFRTYVQSRAAKIFGQEKWQVYLSVFANARSGDTSAQKLYLELIGDYQQTSRVDVKTTVNINQTLNLLLEIIQYHVKDPQLLLAIADDFQAVQEGKTPPSLVAASTETVDTTATKKAPRDIGELVAIDW